jgi:transposase
VAASGTTLREIFGVGPIVAAMFIGYSSDPTRFATAARYAAHTGTASASSPRVAASPIACRGAATGGSITPCTSPRSLRSVTRTASAVATTTASSSTATHREVIRSLKRRLSDVACRHLVVDVQRAGRP